MRVTETESYRNFLSNIEALNEKMHMINQRLATGKKLINLKDAPSESASLIALSEQAADIDQYYTNANSSVFFLQVSESALNEAHNLVTAIYTKGSEAASDTATPEVRATLAAEVRSLRDQILSIANSEARGRYIFAGSQTTSVPFTIAGDTVTYQGDIDVNMIKVDDGQAVKQNVPGNAIFNPIFNAINSLLNGLDTNNTQAIQTALGQFSSALSGLGQIRGQIGVDLNMLQNVKTGLDSQKLNVQTQRSQMEDADLAETIVQLTQIQTALEAVISAAGASLPRKNLFDILS